MLTLICESSVLFFPVKSPAQATVAETVVNQTVGRSASLTNKVSYVKNASIFPNLFCVAFLSPLFNWGQLIKERICSQVLGGVAGVEHLITVHERTQ